MHSGWQGMGFVKEGNEVFVELANDYARATADELWLRAIILLAKQFGVSPHEVAKWDWDMFVAAGQVLSDEAEEVRKAVRRRR